MNPPLRKLSLTVIVMFVTLMLAATYIQFFRADALNADTRNARTLYKEFGTERGPIIVAGDAIASSTPTEGIYKYQRNYPAGDLYSHITGYFSVTHNSMTGLEKYGNSVLGGSDSSLWAQRIEDLFTGAQPQGGALALTIDPAAQKAAYEALAGRRGAVVAIDPQSGKILALLSSPAFDPNGIATQDKKAAEQYWEEISAQSDKPLLNRALGDDLYPPGSIFKVITAAALLEEGASPESVIDAPTTWTLPETNSVVHNTGGACGDGSGKASLRTALVESCNTAFAIAGANLGAEKLIATAEKFGFHKDLTTPLPVRPSRLPKPASKAALAMDAFGQQDVQVSPLQMALVAAAIANNGEMMQPYLIDKVLSADFAPVSQTSPTVLASPISSATAQYLSSMMQDAVEKNYGARVQVPGIKMAGKTGTAEVGGAKAPHAWFIGFEAAENSRVAVAVFIENGGYGIESAAPVAKAVMNAVVNK